MLKLVKIHEKIEWWVFFIITFLNILVCNPSFTCHTLVIYLQLCAKFYRVLSTHVSLQKILLLHGWTSDDFVAMEFALWWVLVCVWMIEFSKSLKFLSNVLITHSLLWKKLFPSLYSFGLEILQMQSIFCLVEFL